ncbi:MAG: GNAT family N-acetyltransferase [Candidatus Sumerlaeaceae bacterium]|jgi:predicted N-acetyltransferase YhbS
MNIRELGENDLATITEIAQQVLVFDPVVEDVIAEKTLQAPDSFPHLGLACEVGGQVVGFVQGAFGVNEEDQGRGYIRLMAVAPSHQRQGVGSALLRELEARLRAAGASEVSVMDVPQNYFMPGLDFRYTRAVCFLLRHGFQMVHENHNMLCDIAPDRWNDLDEQARRMGAEGFDIGRAAREEWPRIASFLDAHWPAWRNEVQRALHNEPPAVFVARHEDRIIAFAAYQGNNRALNWFGPMGTTPECRGRGIGALLLRLCLRELARQGWHQAIIPWVGPICFYARFCGAWLDRCFWVYRKKL